MEVKAEAKAWPKHGEQVSFAGIMSDYKKFMTKKGLPMAAGTLQNMNGSVMVTIWPQTFESFGHYIGNDKFIHVMGKFELEAGKPKILVDKVAPLSGARAIVIGLSTPDQLSAVSGIRGAIGKGMSPVVFEVDGQPGMHVVAHPAMWADPTNDLVNRIEKLCRGATIEVKSLFA